MRTGDVDLPECAHDGSSRVGGLTPESGLHQVGGSEGEWGEQEEAVGLGVEEELMSSIAAVGLGSSLPVPVQHRGSGRAEEVHRTVQGDQLSLCERARAADDRRLRMFC